MKPIISLIIFSFFISEINAQKNKSFELSSPDNTIKIKITTGSRFEWSLHHKNDAIILPSPISLQLENETLGKDAAVTSARTTKVNTTFEAINYHKKTIKDQYNELVLSCKGNYGVIFRVYNDAAAYRFFTKKNGEIIVKNEEANFNFPQDQKAYYPIQWDYRDGKNFNSSFEALYRETNLSAFPKDSLAFLPLLVAAGAHKKVAILEADVEDYPGMYLHPNDNNGLTGVFAPYPLEAEVKERNLIPTRRADYIAKTNGSRNFPWRVVVISENDKELLDQDIIQKLASPPRLTDVSWIKPGQVAWDWWNHWNVTGVDFRAGINMDTYKYYIDFAARHGIPYIIMDEGWYKLGNITEVVPAIDMPELVRYGKQKGVGVILWCVWRTLDNQLEEAMDRFQQWGIKGVKVDFMDRDDQEMVNMQTEILEKAARHHLHVQFHGAYKPTGTARTYPNEFTREGTLNYENDKWGAVVTSDADVNIAFTRALAGSTDYHLGGFRAANLKTFKQHYTAPMVLGTRCHMLGMYVVLENEQGMVCDYPDAYIGQPGFEFLQQVPLTWDETKVLNAKMSDYVTIARRKGDDWYIGTISNNTAHSIKTSLSFLPEGSYTAEIYSDAPDADANPNHLVKVVQNVNNKSILNTELAAGGGQVVRLTRIK